MIKVEHLSKNYNDLQALKDVSFTVQDGEILGFLGPNGAGKTTTMKILTGYTAPTSGTVSVNGTSVIDDPIAVKEQIGYLPESVPLYDDMTVWEYLNFIAEVRFASKKDSTAKKDSLKRVANICGLQKVIRRPIAELSKGYRQRTCLAQALVHNPDILILDEPTSGLDPNQIAEIREVIKEIGREKTVILSTHILQEVQAMCNRVIIISEGEIVAQGTTQELERQTEGRQSLYVKMKGLQKVIHDLLLDIPQTKEVVHKDREGDDIFGFEIVVEGKDDIREIVFRKAASADSPILEMRQEKASLEDIFRQLTQ